MDRQIGSFPQFVGMINCRMNMFFSPSTFPGLQEAHISRFQGEANEVSTKSFERFLDVSHVGRNDGKGHVALGTNMSLLSNHIL